jgi:hypothetical protein
LPHEGLLPVLVHQRINGPVNLLLEEYRIIAFVPPFQFRLDRVTEVRGSQKPLVGAPGFIIDLTHLGTHLLLVNKFDGGQEIIQEGIQGAVDGGQGLEFRGGVEAAVADILPDAFEIFLFDETVIVFLIGACPGEGDAAGMIDKLRAVIAVDAEEGEREGGLDVRKGFQNPFLGFIEEGAEFSD